MTDPNDIDAYEAVAIALRARSVKSLVMVSIGCVVLLLLGTYDPNADLVPRAGRIAFAVISAGLAVASGSQYWASSLVLKEAAVAREKASAASGEPE